MLIYQCLSHFSKVIHKKNEGVSKARNTGLDNAKGTYIMFVDSDDYVDKDMLKEMYSLIKEKQADISIIGVEDILEDNTRISGFKEERTVLSGEQALGELLNAKYFTSVCWGKLYKAELWKDIRFKENIKIAEDLEVLYYIFKRANKVTIDTNKKYYYYTVREDSTIQQPYNEDWEKEIDICKDILEKIKKENPKIKKQAIKRYVTVNMNSIIRILKMSKDKSKAKTLKKNIRPYIISYILNKDVKGKTKLRLVIILLNDKIYKKISKS